MVPITASIIILLVIVYFSYRQIIEAYPTGGGSYTVARQNLGEFSGVLAAAALMIDYVPTAAVGISAGVGALVSAVPSLQPHTLLICLVILLLITIVNLRGVRETGAVFIVPTYLTMGSILLVLALSANTAFADFPRLCRALAEDGYLPQGFASRGRRLLYSQGIWVLAVLRASLLILFGGWWSGIGVTTSCTINALNG